MEQATTNSIREFLIPIIVAVLVGIGASYISVNSAVAVLEAQVTSVQTEIADLKGATDRLKVTTARLAAREAWMVEMDREFSELRDRISKIERTQYTEQDAIRDQGLIMREIELRHSYDKRSKISSKVK